MCPTGTAAVTDLRDPKRNYPMGSEEFELGLCYYSSLLKQINLFGQVCFKAELVLFPILKSTQFAFLS